MKKKFETLWASKKQDWQTPLWLFKKLDSYYHFITDPCTSIQNPLGCKIFFTSETGGLDLNHWKGNVFINPEYRNIKPWIIEARKYFKWVGNSVVLLIPARPGNRLWQQEIFPSANLICFIAGRLRFSGSDNSAPFDSALIVFGYISEEEKNLYNQLGHTI